MSNPSSNTTIPPPSTAATSNHPPTTTTLSSQTSPTNPSSQPPQQPPVSPAQRTSEARTAFLASLHSASSALDSDLTSRAKNIHSNAKALQKQEEAVEKEIKGLRRRNEEMERVVGGMKGDWGREMERLGFGGKRKDGGQGEGGFGEEDDFEEEMLLGDVERELGRLEEWVRIVEEGDEDGEGEESEREEGGDGRYERQLPGQNKGKAKEVVREEGASASVVK